MSTGRNNGGSAKPSVLSRMRSTFLPSSASFVSSSSSPSSASHAAHASSSASISAGLQVAAAGASLVAPMLYNFEVREDHFGLDESKEDGLEIMDVFETQLSEEDLKKNEKKLEEFFLSLYGNEFTVQQFKLTEFIPKLVLGFAKQHNIAFVKVIDVELNQLKDTILAVIYSTNKIACLQKQNMIRDIKSINFFDPQKVHYFLKFMAADLIVLLSLILFKHRLPNLKCCLKNYMNHIA